MTANCEECERLFVVTDRQRKLIAHDGAIFCDICNGIIKSTGRITRKEGMPLIDENVEPYVGIVGRC